MTHTSVSMTWHTSWIAGANQIHCTTQNFCGAQWASKPWFDTIHQTKQTDMVMAFWLEPLALYQTHDSQSTSSWSVTTATTTDNIFFLKFFKCFVFVFFTFFFMIIRSCDLNAEKTTDDKADLSTASPHVSMKAFFIFMMWREKEVLYFDRNLKPRNVHLSTTKVRMTHQSSSSSLREGTTVQ